MNVCRLCSIACYFDSLIDYLSTSIHSACFLLTVACQPKSSAYLSLLSLTTPGLMAVNNIKHFFMPCHV